jgi:hypothetical protein
MVVHGADPMRLTSRPSLVIGVMSEWPSLLRQKDSTLAAFTPFLSLVSNGQMFSFNPKNGLWVGQTVYTGLLSSQARVAP